MADNINIRVIVVTLLALCCVLSASKSVLAQDKSAKKPLIVRVLTNDDKGITKVTNNAVFDGAAAKSLVDKVLTDPGYKLKTFGELTSGIDTNTYTYSVDEALDLKIPFAGSVDAKSSRRILVRNYVVYKEWREGDQTVQVGVGVQWIVNLKSVDLSGNLAFSALAASAQLKQCESSVRFHIVGLVNPDLLGAANVPADMNVENYVKMSNAFDKCIDIIKSLKSSDSIDPPITSQTVEQRKFGEQDYTNAIATAWAIARIAEGKTIIEAQNSFPDQSPPSLKSIENTYLDIAKIGEPNTKPDSVAVAIAKKLLQKLQIKK